MKTIVIASQKGGSGKTTLASHLAVEAERVGDGPAWVIDTDPQRTLSHWHERRENESPHRLEVAFDRLAIGVQSLQDRAGAYCFIDTAPTISKQTENVLAVADLVLIPVRPSPADLWSVSETIARVKQSGRRFMFVITQAKAQATITAQAVAALSQHGPVAEAFLGDRVPYAVAMTGGRTAPEIGAQSPAAEEIRALWDNVKSCFVEKRKPVKEVVHG
jgi:chromosome partitioning protein